MFRLPVAGQNPLYLKVEYRSHPSSGGYMVLRFSVGVRWVSNGTLSINLTGSTVEPIAVTLAEQSNDTVTRNCWMSCDPAGGFVFVHAYDSNSARCLYVIDSCRTASGVAESSGFSVMRMRSDSTYISNIDPLNGLQSSSSKWPCLTKGSNSSSVKDASGETTLFPVCQSNAQGSFISKMVIGYNINDIPGTTIFRLHILAQQERSEQDQNLVGYQFIMSQQFLQRFCGSK